MIKLRKISGNLTKAKFLAVRKVIQVNRGKKNSINSFIKKAVEVIPLNDVNPKEFRYLRVHII